MRYSSAERKVATSPPLNSQTCLFAKSTAELLKETFKGNNQLIYPLTWVIVLMMVFTIMMETHWLATGLKFFDALYIVPTFQVFFVMSSVIGGAIFFQGESPTQDSGANGSTAAVASEIMILRTSKRHN